MGTYDYPTFEFTPPAELDGKVQRHKVAVIGAGPVGLAAALDLARRGISSVVVDDDNSVSIGSRAICWSKRSLEILDRIGVADRMVEKGITWKLGRVFNGDEEVYRFDLLPESGHKLPAFVNLQQYYVEEYLVERAQAEPLIDLRFSSRMIGIEVLETDGVRLDVETPLGTYVLEADYVLAADGARSPTRKLMGLSFDGKVFEDRFLIADVRMQADFPTERWFWFNPPFHNGDSTLLHRQADNVFRIDLQLGWDADPEVEKQPDRVISRLKRMLGEDVAFDLEWISVYTFQCRRLKKFRHGPVFFIGDSAHQVSPFGARGGNGGLQDVDALTWKLELVLKDLAPDTLLDSYDLERIPATDENILNSTRSTDFLTPKSEVARDFRDAVLALAKTQPFARRHVNSGRLSLPHHYNATPLSTYGTEFGALSPGSPCPDAPVRTEGRDGWLLNRLGDGFTWLCFDAPAPAPDTDLPTQVLTVGVDMDDPDGLIAARYGPDRAFATLIRPDHHVAARLKSPSPAEMKDALDRAAGRIAGSDGRRATA